MNNTNYEKSLPEVFNELRESRQRQALQNTKKCAQKLNKVVIEKAVKPKKTLQLETDNFNYDIFQENYNKTEVIDHKFNAIGAIIGILFIIMFMTTVKSNYIFATNKEEKKEIIGTYEENESPIDLMACVSENISEVVRKEITTEKIILNKEIEYIEDNQLPRGEEIILQAGKDGYKEITYIRSYENEELTGEVVVSDTLVEEPQKSVIRLGTSEFLANNKVHIGDTMYTLEQISLMREAREDSERICSIYQYIDLKIQVVQDDGWSKIVVDGIEGYVESSLLTSAAIQPNIVEKSRVKRLMLTLKFDMEINKPSGLTRADFVKVLSGNSRDTNDIFENNAGLFYDIEQKYNVNGIFLASIGIHESNWGTSTIAREKKNLFGYGAYDSSPYASSVTFESYEYGIELLAKVLSKYYINEPGTAIYDGETAVGSYYNGPTVSGVNVRYATDQNWANRVYDTMLSLYEKLER